VRQPRESEAPNCWLSGGPLLEKREKWRTRNVKSSGQECPVYMVAADIFGFTT